LLLPPETRSTLTVLKNRGVGFVVVALLLLLLLFSVLVLLVLVLVLLSPVSLSLLCAVEANPRTTHGEGKGRCCDSATPASSPLAQRTVLLPLQSPAAAVPAAAHCCCCCTTHPALLNNCEAWRSRERLMILIDLGKKSRSLLLCFLVLIENVSFVTSTFYYLFF
jgi:hypothetical protein